MSAELNTALNILTHIETFLAFLVFIVPGFISLRTYEARRGGEGRKINDAIVDVVIYSFATDIVWIPIWYAVGTLPPSTERVVAFIIVAILGFIATPMGLAVGWYEAQTRLARGGIVADPTAKPWDKFFNAIARERLDIGLILTLPDGRKLGGRHIPPGFASHYPAEEQLHVGETWILDQETGAFLERVKGSKGFIIDKKDLLSIEFVEWSTVEPPEKSNAHG